MILRPESSLVRRKASHRARSDRAANTPLESACPHNATLRHGNAHVCAPADRHPGPRPGSVDHLSTGRQWCLSAARTRRAARRRLALVRPQSMERITPSRFELIVCSRATRWVTGERSPAPIYDPLRCIAGAVTTDWLLQVGSAAWKAAKQRLRSVASGGRTHGLGHIAVARASARPSRQRRVSR